MANQEFTVFSGSPDDFGVGFLDDFDGVVTYARYCPHRYSKDPSKKKHGLFVKIRIKPDDQEDEIEVFQRAGFLNTFLPSKNGTQPAGATLEEYKELEQGRGVIQEGTEEEYEGEYIITPGKSSKQLPPSDHHQFMHNLRELGFKTVDPKISIIEGLHCHFNRLPIDESVVEINGKKIQVNQKMPAIEGQEAQREWKFLCPTAIHGQAKVTNGKTKASSTPTTSTISSSTVTDDKESALETTIQLYLMENGEVADKDLKQAIVKAQESTEAKHYSLAQMSKADWMRSSERPWVFSNGKYSNKE